MKAKQLEVDMSNTIVAEGITLEETVDEVYKKLDQQCEVVLVKIKARKKKEKTKEKND
jgi:hypothetical protein